jgi:partner of Y14 and mago protein
MPTESASSQAGIQTTQSGERHIPSSVRPDGSTRKEIKIRPGYRPPEDVEVYKNRTAEAWKTRGSGGVPGAAEIDDDSNIKTNNKNAKRREARKKAKATLDSAEEAGAKGTAELGSKAQRDGETESSQEGPTDPSINSGEQVSVEREKQSRNLRKKLRQARELKEKKDSGESLLPDQFAKVIKIQELVRQLEMLGFDADGNPKEPSDPAV